jgi:hypothetical protein
MKSTPFFSGSVIGSRPGSVAVRVTGCPGAAWVWRPAHRPGGSIRAGRTLALAVPVVACPHTCARAVARMFPGLAVSVRAVGSRFILRVRGGRLFACACWWSGALERAGFLP